MISDVLGYQQFDREVRSKDGEEHIFTGSRTKHVTGAYGGYRRDDTISFAFERQQQ